MGCVHHPFACVDILHCISSFVGSYAESNPLIAVVKKNEAMIW